jgi:hypothetical protein
MSCAAQAGALCHNNTNDFFFVFSEITCKNIMCTRQQIFLYIQDKWGATLQEQLEILENKFSAITVCRFFISQNSKDKLLQSLISKMKRNDSHRTLHVFNAKNENWLEQNVSIEVSTCLLRFYNSHFHLKCFTAY